MFSAAVEPAPDAPDICVGVDGKVDASETVAPMLPRQPHSITSQQLEEFARRRGFALDRAGRLPQALRFGLLLGEVAVISGSVIILVVVPAADDVLFPCDKAALGLSGVCLVVGTALALADFADGGRGRRVFVCAALKARCRQVLEVAAAGLLVLVLLDHATLLLFQLLLILAASAWTAFACSVAAQVFQYCMGEVRHPLLLLLLAFPSLAIWFCWLILAGLALGVLHFKPFKDIGVPDEISIVEFYSLYGIGGMFISGFFCWIALWLLSSFRHVFAGQFLLVPHEIAELAPGARGLDACVRGLALSVGMHIFAIAFPILFVYGVIAAVILAMANQSMRYARSVQLTEKEEKKLKEKREKKKDCKDTLKNLVVVMVMLVFGMAKFAALLVIFVFDVVFVQKYLATTVTRNFVLAGTGRECGQASSQVANHVKNPLACAKIASSKYAAFSFGTGSKEGECFGHTLPSDFGNDQYNSLVADRLKWECPGSASWKTLAEVDYYVLEPLSSCSVFTSRRLTSASNVTRAHEETLDRERVFFFSGAFQMPGAIEEIFKSLRAPKIGAVLASIVSTVMELSRSLLAIQFSVPSGVQLRCTGIRRLISGSALLGVCMISGILPSVDVLSILSACREIAKARSTGRPFLKFLFAIARAEGFYRGACFIMQITISSALNLQDEAYGVVNQRCGLLVNEENLAGTVCPVSWHAPVDIFATLLIYFSLGMAVVLILMAFGGLLYEQPPTRWLVKTLFHKDLELVTFSSDKVKECITEDGGRGFWQKLCDRKVLRPFLAVPVTLGIWTNVTVDCYHIGHRKMCFEPIDNKRKEGRAGARLVTWKSMFDATGKLIGLVWLAFPYIGATMSKGTQYMNEFVIFAYGDAGHPGETLQPVANMFRQNKPSTVQQMHWMSQSGQLLALALINFDFLKDAPFETRLWAIGICIIVVTLLAAVRVWADLRAELQTYSRANGAVSFCTDVVKAGVAMRVSEDPLLAQNAELLGKLCGEHERSIVKACSELCELEWVQHKSSPDTQAEDISSLQRDDGAASRRMTQGLYILAKQQVGSAEAKNHRAIATAAALLLLRESAHVEISTLRAHKAARETSHQRAYDEAAQRGPELQQWAQEHASNDAVAVARLRLQAYQEAKQLATWEGRSKPDEPVRWVRMKFEVKRRCVAKSTCTWTASNIQLDEEAHFVDLVASGELELKWPQGATPDHLSEDDVQVIRQWYKLSESRPEVSCDDVVNSGWAVDGEVQVNDECGVCNLTGAELNCGCLRKKALATVRQDAGKQTGAWHMKTSLSWPPATVASDGKPNGWSSVDQVAWAPAGADGAPIGWSVTEVKDPDKTMSLVGDFLGCLGSRGMASEAASEAAKRAHLKAVASRMVRNKRVRERAAEAQTRATTPTPAQEEEQTRATTAAPAEEAPPFLRVTTTQSAASSWTIPSAAYDAEPADPLEALREAMVREPPNADELSGALEVARRADVDPMVLAEAEKMFLNVLGKQQKALALVQALDKGMIVHLRAAIKGAVAVGMDLGEFQGADGIGVLQRAQYVLSKEEDGVRTALDDALQLGGILRLQRALAQAREFELDDPDLIFLAEAMLLDVCERKRRIALINSAMNSNDAALLRSAIEECERDGLPDGAEIDLRKAKEQLAALEEAARRADEETMESRARRKSKGPEALKKIRAKAALRAAVYQDKPDAAMLRLAVTQAKSAGCEGTDLEKATEILAREEAKQGVIEELKEAAASRDVAQLLEALARARDLGVDPKRVLMALAQLIEEQARVAQKAGDHGLSSLVLSTMENERRMLHESVQNTYGAIRVVCRVRAPLPEEGVDPGSKMAVERVDRFSVAVQDHVYRLGTVFGPDSIQAEVFNELRGLVQSALDGFNVLIMACGPARGGKTWLMHGGSSAESRGVLPRAVDELFAISGRDDWRCQTEIDIQILELHGSRDIVDVLGVRRAALGAAGPQVRLVSRCIDDDPGFHSRALITKPFGVFANEGVAPRDTPRSALSPGPEGALSTVVIEGAATRRVGSKAELKHLVEDVYKHHEGSGGHKIAMVHVTRTKRATGAMVRSKLVFADLAGCGACASEETAEAYDALEAVFKALAHRERKVPFRDHKLAQVLQDCIGGTAKTTLLLALSQGCDAQAGRDALRAVQLVTAGQT